MEPTTQAPAEPQGKLPQQKEVPLTDGRTAIVKRGKGRALIKAQTIASKPAEIPLALASVMTTIDGQPLIYEDLLDMDLADTMAIQTAAMSLAGNDTQTAS